MRRLVRNFAVALLGTTFLTASASAYTGNGKLLNDQQIADLESRAERAQAKDQPYLYAEIIAQMTVRLDSEMAAGQLDKATTHLNRVAEYTRRLHSAIGADARKLRDAEILIRETSLRMDQMVKQSSLDNRDTLHAVAAKLNEVQSELMLKVFAH